MKLRTCAVLLAVSLTGCATAPPPSTPSGKLELMLSNVDFSCVRSGLANVLVSAGYNVEKMSDYQIVAGKITKNGMASFLLSTPMSGAPEERVTITMLPQINGSSLRVVWDAAYVSNPGTAYEKFTPIGASQANEEQLNSLAPRIEQKCPRHG
jgi:hypothetical protein